MNNLLALTNKKLSTLEKIETQSFVESSLNNSALTIANSCNENNTKVAISTLCCYLKVSRPFDESIDFSEVELTTALIADGVSQTDLDTVSNVYRTRSSSVSKKAQKFEREESGLIKAPVGAKAPLGITINTKRCRDFLYTYDL